VSALQFVVSTASLRALRISKRRVVGLCLFGRQHAHDVDTRRQCHIGHSGTSFVALPPLPSSIRLDVRPLDGKLRGVLQALRAQKLVPLASCYAEINYVQHFCHTLETCDSGRHDRLGAQTLSKAPRSHSLRRDSAVFCADR
jgi:hypothetical protein